MGRKRARRAPGSRSGKRAPGRPVGTGGQRERLLDAAQTAFSSVGYAGSSLRSIALAAHVTPALAHYYFADKAGLLEIVITERVAPLVQGLVAAVQAAGDDSVGAAFAFLHRYTVMGTEHPWLPRLVVREVLNEQGVLRETFVSRFAGTLGETLKELVRRGQRSGAFRRDVDPALAVMSLISLCVFPFVAAPLVEGVLGIRIRPGNAPALAKHHLGMFMHGLGGKP